MKSLLSRRPSPALVIACIALFVSLGGVSYGVATGFIDSREIKNNEVRSLDLRNNEVRTRDLRNNEIRGIDIRNSTVQGRDIALNTVHGEDVREDTLGKVPSAIAADRATTATNATSAAAAGGVTPEAFNYRGEAGSEFVQVLSLAGLTVRARCVAPAELEVEATTATANSEIASKWDDDPGTQDATFNPGDVYMVVDGLTGAAAQQGHASFAGSDGRLLTIQAMSVQQLDGVGSSTNDCGFSGVALAG